MKLAVISDIHGNLPALQAVLADIARQRVDQTVNLGDILSGPLQPAETADLLMAQDFPTIRGNHERAIAGTAGQSRQAVGPGRRRWLRGTQVSPAHVAWLKSLPATLALNSDVWLCHGTPDNDLAYWLETAVPGFEQGAGPGVRAASLAEVSARLGQATTHPVVLCGHTHVPRAVQCGGVLVVNPGSVGLQAYDDNHPYLHVIENRTPHARYALLEKTRQGWQVELLAVPYDHMAQASVAERRQRPDWAHALATGFAKRPG